LAVETTWPLWIATAVSQWFFVGPAEELGARAYLQSKVIALLGGGRSRWRKAAGILLAAVLFGLWHIPQRIFVQGMTFPQVLPDVVSLIIFALIFGLLYEWTRNVVLCGLLHGMLNYEPHFFPFEDPVGMEWLSPMISLTALASIVLAIWLYRRWAVAHRPGGFWPPMEATSSRRLVWPGGLAETEKEA
jgi:membrane protease YdiL (CAAX protease family)